MVVSVDFDEHRDIGSLLGSMVVSGSHSKLCKTEGSVSICHVTCFLTCDVSQRTGCHRLILHELKIFSVILH